MGIKIDTLSSKQKEIPEEFKDLAKDFAEKGFITTSTDNLINWARTGSLHWMTFGLACCAVEMMQTSMPRYDLERFGAAARNININWHNFITSSYYRVRIMVITSSIGTATH